MQRIIQIKHKKREQIANPSFFLSMESLCIKCNLWEQLCLTFREEKNNNRNFLKCSHQNAILWRGLSFIGSHPFRLREAFLHCVFLFFFSWRDNHYAMICSFSTFSDSRQNTAHHRIISRLTMEISLRALLCNLILNRFVSLCVFYVRPINLPVEWTIVFLFRIMSLFQTNAASYENLF